MRRLALVLAGLLWASPALAQVDTTYESIAVTNTAVGLAAATYQPASAPLQMVFCVGRLEVAEVRYRMDGTAPTATEGILLEVGEIVTLVGAGDLSRFKAIRTGATSAVLKVQCWATPRPVTEVQRFALVPGVPISCVVAVSTATTVQAVGGSCAAPGAGLSIYITDVEFGSSAASGTAADSFPTLKSGTGGTCGSATAVIWQALGVANSTTVANYTTPVKVTANNEVCWIMSTAGSKTIQIRGYIAP